VDLAQISAGDVAAFRQLPGGEHADGTLEDDDDGDTASLDDRRI